MSLEKDAIIKFEEVEKRIHSLNKKTLNNTENIKSISETTTSLEGQLAVLNDKIDLVSKKETFNTFDRRLIHTRKPGFDIFSLDRIYFLCSKSSMVKLNITLTVRFHSTAEYTATLYHVLNSNNVVNNFGAFAVTYNGYLEHIFNCEYEFYPRQENNYIFIQLRTGNTNPANARAELVRVNVSAQGRNIIFLNRSNEFKVFVSKNYYYLTKNIISGGSYLLAPSNNVNLFAPFAPIPPLVSEGISLYDNRYLPYNYTYMPNIVYNSTTNKYEIDHSIPFFAFCVVPSSLVASAAANPPPATQNVTPVTTKGWTYVVGHPGNNDLTPRNFAIVNSGNTYLPGLTNSASATSSNVFLRINGVNVTGSWVANVPVFAKNWEDVTNNPYMCVATDEFGDNYFFPERYTTYTVYVGKGTQLSAYLRTDNSVVVYMRWLDKVYKKLITYNESTLRYELAGTIAEFDDTWEIIEGYTTDYFINRKGTWEYVPPT
jgi:hypothetical protein